ncbi:MAG: ThuA domain-containing protein [Bacteroidota bacterium]
MKYLLNIFIILLFFVSVLEAQKIRVLIIDGQNNHVMWPKTTMMMKQYLEASERFEVDIRRTQYTWKGEAYLAKFPLNRLQQTQALPQPKSDEHFTPDFFNYDVILTNFGWKTAPWPEQTQHNLEQYIEQGGGLVVIHAADNAFPDWPAYNQMIGLGGWGGRTEKSGPYVYYDDKGKLIRDESAGNGGAHGTQHEYQIQIRTKDHPITKGMPKKWLHTKDELYDRLRGPAENMTILATAYAAAEYKGTSRHEPILMTIDYGKGRIFHTPMGHADYSMECVGFITCLLRGTEWAATGAVTQEIPKDFPKKKTVSKRAFVWQP